MHDQGMAHGNLKGVRFQPVLTARSPNSLLIKANILIDSDHHARLADFWGPNFVSDRANPTASNSTANTGGTIRWMGPELLHPQKFGLEDGRPTKESDYYAFGMVILEVLSGQTPFARDEEVVVMRKVLGGEVPGRPEATWFTEDLWGILEQCWSFQPEARPDLGTILECLERASLATAIDSQQRLIRRSFSQDELPYLLETVFQNDRESTHVVESLQGGDPQVFVDIVNEARRRTNSHRIVGLTGPGPSAFG